MITMTNHQKMNTKKMTIAAPLVSTLGLAAISWFVSIRQMNGMDMGIATQLGSLGSFICMWVVMMAAMMLPGISPLVLKLARAGERIQDVLLFVGSYLTIWTLFGLAVFAFYQPHSSYIAGVITIGAGIYELTPLKRYFRRCCFQVSSGFECGLHCVGLSFGLMLMQVALGVMSIGWMIVIAAIISAQKFQHPKAAIDVPLGLAIVGFGIFIIIAPASIPGLIPPM